MAQVDTRQPVEPEIIRISVALTPKLHTWLEARAADLHVSMSTLGRLIFLDYKRASEAHDAE